MVVGKWSKLRRRREGSGKRRHPHCYMRDGGRRRSSLSSFFSLVPDFGRGVSFLLRLWVVELLGFSTETSKNMIWG